MAYRSVLCSTERRQPVLPFTEKSGFRTGCSAFSSYSLYSVVKDRLGFFQFMFLVFRQGRSHAIATLPTTMTNTEKTKTPSPFGSGVALFSLVLLRAYGKTETERSSPVLAGRSSIAPALGFCSLPVLCHIKFIVFSRPFSSQHRQYTPNLRNRAIVF